MSKTQRNPGNVQPNVDGQVFVSFKDDPKISLQGEFSEDWETVGILLEGSKIELNRAIEKNKAKGWGFGVVATSTKPGDLTGKCTVLERNATVQRIAWPDTVTATGGKEKGSVLRHTGKAAQVHVAFVTVDQKGVMTITATRQKALATMPNLSMGEDPEGKEIEFEFESGVYKDAFDYLEIEAPAEAEGDVTPIRFAESLEKPKGDLEEDEEEAGSESVTVTLPENPTGGTFTLKIGTAKSAAIAHDATATAVQLIVRQVKGGETATVTGDAGGPYTLTGVKYKVTADGSALEGSESKEITVA